MSVPSRARASGSRHLPWAFLRVLRASSEGKDVGGDYRVGLAYDAVCLRDASSVFIRGRCDNGTAAKTAGRRRGNGRDGKPSNAIGRRRRENGGATVRANVTVNGCGSGKLQHQKRLGNRRGSSQTTFFEPCC